MSLYLEFLLKYKSNIQLLCLSMLQQIPMFVRSMKPQGVSTLEVFSTKIAVQARMVLNVGPLYVSADVGLPGGEFPTDGTMPDPVHFVHHGLYLGIKRREQI